MKKCLPIWAAVLIGVAAEWQASGQIYDTNNEVVQTFAGSGFSGYLDGVGQQTMFNSPSAVVADSTGNLFVMDAGNNLIRKITTNATVTTFAGGGSNQPPGYGTNVALPGSFATMTIDHSNALWITDSTSSFPNSTLMRIGSDGFVWVTNVSPVVFANGLCVDSHNNLYISDSSGDKIYRLDTKGALTVFVGSGNAGAEDGNGVFDSFDGPAVMTTDAADTIYVWDENNRLIRKVYQNQNVVTIAGNPNGPIADGTGTNATFNSLAIPYIHAMCVDYAGNVILACGQPGSGFCIRKIDATTNVTTMAGSFTQYGYTNGAGSIARFYGSYGVCVSQGQVYVADSFNQRIRNIAFNPAPQPVSPGNLNLANYPGLQITGTVGRTYQIQTSADLTNWNTVTTILLGSSPFLWIDTNSVGPKKFYRAFLLP